MLKQEWRKLFKNKILLIVTVAVIAIPTIYTTLFLGSMWDPYGNIDKLPVAVINHDVPVTYADQELDIELLFDPSGNYTHHYASTSETGLATPAQDGGVSIYPTIVIDNFTVDAQEDGFSVEIFTIDGAKVFTTLTNGNHLSVDNANLTSGLYLVKVTQAGKVLATQRIVKQ